MRVREEIARYAFGSRTSLNRFLAKANTKGYTWPHFDIDGHRYPITVSDGGFVDIMRNSIEVFDDGVIQIRPNLEGAKMYFEGDHLPTIIRGYASKSKSDILRELADLEDHVESERARLLQEYNDMKPSHCVVSTPKRAEPKFIVTMRMGKRVIGTWYGRPSFDEMLQVLLLFAFEEEAIEVATRFDCSFNKDRSSKKGGFTRVCNNFSLSRGSSVEVSN